MASLLVRAARIVPIRSAAPVEPVDLRIADGQIVARGRLAPEPGDRVVDAEGRWAIPGLWDQHVHFAQWAQTRTRLDVSGTNSPGEVLALVRDHLRSADPGSWVFGFGFRLAPWDRQPTVAELDAVTAGHPVALTSGDAHNGWLNSAALAALGAPDTDGPLTEATWFALLPRVIALTERDQDDDAVTDTIATASARGVTGIVDFEMAAAFRAWPALHAAGIGGLRVRAAVYPDLLDEVLAEGLRSGDALTADGLVTMGPLKIISDGSLNTRTAYCRHRYAGSQDRGVQNHDLADLVDLLTRATTGGLEVAVHAIGDAAVRDALSAFARTGARGSIEHAQVMTPDDVAAMAGSGIRASVQPAHLPDDRDATARLWPDQVDRCFPLRSLLDAGVPLALGSDAPVARLDPWEAMAAAVHRSGDDRPAWNPAESITAAEALAASVDGCDTLTAGSPADLVLLDDDPLRVFDTTAETAAHLRAMPVAATLLAGRFTYGPVSSPGLDDMVGDDAPDGARGRS